MYIEEFEREGRGGLPLPGGHCILICLYCGLVAANDRRVCIKVGAAGEALQNKNECDESMATLKGSGTDMQRHIKSED